MQSHSGSIHSPHNIRKIIMNEWKKSLKFHLYRRCAVNFNQFILITWFLVFKIQRYSGHGFVKCVTISAFCGFRKAITCVKKLSNYFVPKNLSIIVFFFKTLVCTGIKCYFTARRNKRAVKIFSPILFLLEGRKTHFAPCLRALKGILWTKSIVCIMIESQLSARLATRQSLTLRPLAHNIGTIAHRIR